MRFRHWDRFSWQRRGTPLSWSAGLASAPSLKSNRTSTKAGMTFSAPMRENFLSVTFPVCLKVTLTSVFSNLMLCFYVLSKSLNSARKWDRILSFIIISIIWICNVYAYQLYIYIYISTVLFSIFSPIFLKQLIIGVLSLASQLKPFRKKKKIIFNLYFCF